METKNIARIAIIAALYAVITIIFTPISYGPIQVRISEALTVLPFFIPQSIWGLFLGCLIANFYGGYGVIDIIFGSLATLLAGFLTRKMPSIYLAPLPPVIVNAVVVGFILKYVAGLPLILTMLEVGLGQLLACYVLGLPLLFWFQKNEWGKER